MDNLVSAPQCATLLTCTHAPPLGPTFSAPLLAHITSAAAHLLVPGSSFPPGTLAPIPPMAGGPWPSQAMPYVSAFMAPPSWPVYMPSYMPRPPVQLVSMQTEFEELAMQPQELEARELEVQQMTLNLNAVPDARVTTSASVTGSKHSRSKEQAPLKPRRASSQVASQRYLTPSGSPP